MLMCGSCQDVVEVGRGSWTKAAADGMVFLAMPFTPAHAVISKPLTRVMPGVPLAAVIAGSVSPDLEFFWHLEAHRTVGHLWPGVITLSLPLGALALAIWHLALRPGIVALLPQPLGHLMRPERFRSSDLFPSLVGLIVGTASHIIWDWFTHPNNPGPQLLGYSNSIAGNLQTLSGAVGLGVLMFWAWPHLSELRHHPMQTWFTDHQKGLLRRAVVVGAAVGFMTVGLAALTATKRGIGPVLVWTYLSSVYAAAAAIASARLPLEVRVTNRFERGSS